MVVKDTLVSIALVVAAMYGAAYLLNYGNERCYDGRVTLQGQEYACRPIVSELTLAQARQRMLQNCLAYQKRENFQISGVE